MVPPEFWLLGGSVFAFAGALLLVARRERRSAGTFAAMADAQGWDHRDAPPEGLAERLLSLARVAPAGGGELYLAGPTHVGPFQLVRLGGPSRGRGMSGAGQTFVHLRMRRAVRGLWIHPADRFRVGGGDRDGPFARRFDVEATDADDVARVIDDDMMALLLRPHAPVRVAWEDHDLVVVFPVGVRSAHEAAMLIRYATAVGLRAAGSHGRPAIGAQVAYEPSTTVTAA